ncbi:alpha/beta-hydrolase [Lophiostoma macrostomum CBS 122681]|uniref:Alpha/beta-hydrolase n=1 Tax=Lophiostoma macrostomum CBS 122681 TaxID=1314788 RepID=A0A6A6SW78_9PLEO|nr:alpha/beta-hydrolase [Lophiostoma macrostomum CBS 122681]
MLYPASYIVEPQPGHSHSHTIILLHGRSSTAEVYASDLFALKTTDLAKNLPSHFPNFRWVFPDAGERWCIAYKEERSAWCHTYSLQDMSLRQDLQVQGLRNGVYRIEDIVHEEVERLGGQSQRVFLAGFSMGSAVALWSIFTGAAFTSGKLGAFLGLSAWMPFTREAMVALEQRIPTATHAAHLKSLSVTFLDILGIDSFTSCETIQKSILEMLAYLGHGTDDIPVSVSYCRDLTGILRSLKVQLETREYIGAEREGHWVKEPEQLDDVVTFLRTLMNDTSWGGLG